MNGAKGFPPSKWGSEIKFKVDEPTNGRRYHFNLTVISYGTTRVFENLRDTTTRWRRLVIWLTDLLKRFR